MFVVADKRTFDIIAGEDSSYIVRPLVRYGYISKWKDGIYTICAKGRYETEVDYPFISVNGNKNSREKAIKTSYICALFFYNDIFPSSEISEVNKKYFIPSCYWRKIRTSILSTTRFVGMLIYNDLKLAVYLIDSADMEWQLYAEGSLFFRTYGSWATEADGMLMICPENAADIAKRIIQRTMWQRKNLIKGPYGYENDKPVRYAKSPIRIKSTYKMVLFTDTVDLKKTLERISNIHKIKLNILKQMGGEFKEFQTCEIVRKNDSVCINPQNDLLKFIELYIDCKIQSNEKYKLIMNEKYKNIAEMIGCEAIYV